MRILFALMLSLFTSNFAHATTTACQLDRFAETTFSNDPLAVAKQLYKEVPTPQNRMQQREELRKFLNHPGNADKETHSIAWAWLALTLASDHAEGWNDAGTVELVQADGALARARSINGDFALAYYAGGFILRAFNQHDAALDSYMKVIQLDPTCDRGFAQVGNELINLGRPAESPPYIQQALDLNPSPSAQGKIFYIMGKAYYFAQDYANAVVWLEQSVTARPNLWFNRTYLIAAYVLINDLSKAQMAMNEFLTVFPGYTVSKIRELQDTNPDDKQIIIDGRERMFEALLAAGMPEN